MAELGTFALLSALAVALFGIACAVVGLRRRDPTFAEAALRAVRVWAAFIGLAAAALLWALLTRDFSVRFVAEVTRRDLPLAYTVTAFWGGHAGSLLLWACALALYGVAATASLRREPALAPYVTLVLLIIAAFFTALLAWSSPPFEAVQVPPPDGRGLNPLLRNPWMAAHPPALYLGFVGMTVPFALTIAALATGRTEGGWLRLARGWVLWSWLCLTLGLLFGARWSYVVLGWGGYWAWDPVENAALMPWLTSTAFLHAVQVRERRGLLSSWTIALLLLSFALAILGTFLTRSGVLGSVHAFATSTVGVYFLTFLTVSVLISFGLLFWRRGLLRDRTPLETVVSREAAFLVNNVLFVVAAAVILVGTVFPILAEALTGDRLNVGPPYFNAVMVPIVLLLLAVMAVGPLLSWRRSDPEALRRSLAAPGAAGVLAAAALAAGGLRHPGALVTVALCVFVAGTIVLEVARGAGLRRARGEPVLVALIRLIDRDRRRYGGFLVHFGVLVMLVGITASSGFAMQIQATLRPGDHVAIGRYVVQYDGVHTARESGRRITTAVVTPFLNGRVTGALRAAQVHDDPREETTAQVGIASTWRDDLYVALVAASPQDATFRVLLNPMVRWVWVGGTVILVGGVIAAVPRR